MNVLLILAAIPELKPSAAKSIPIMAPPLTLPVLGEICRRAGHSPTYLDSRFHLTNEAAGWQIDVAGLRRAIEASAADVACISFLSSSFPLAVEIAAICRASGQIVLAGGVHATVAPHDLAASGAFDFVFQGEAEQTLPIVLAEIATRGADARNEIPRIVEPRITHSADIPVPTDLDYYAPVYAQFTHRVAYVETTRGCFKKCRFCEVSQFGAAWKPLRRIPLDRVCAGVDHVIQRHDVNYILVADSVATIYRDQFAGLMAHMRCHHPRVTVQFNSTVDRWNEEIANACQGIPCSVWFGFESGSQRVLTEIIDKGATVQQALDAARLCEDRGIRCAFNILIGLPGETDDDLEATLDVLAKCPSVYPNPNIFTPLPGTPLYSECLANGTLRDPADFQIWDVDRIDAAGMGPVLGVDYERVVRWYRTFSELQRDPARNVFSFGP